MIKVLITDDSPVVRGYLKYILSSDKDIQVIGEARNGKEAVERVQEEKPDVVTMDIHMPQMDGFEATRRIMETNPVPIVICSASWNPEEVDKTFRTMEAGAVAALEKPRGMGHPDSDSSVKTLLRTVKAMADVKVVRRWSKKKREQHPPRPVSPSPQPARQVSRTVVPAVLPSKGIQVVAIGASTGGPMALQTILSGLPADFKVPVLIVQHIAPGFLAGLGSWLTTSTGYQVVVPEDGEAMIPGTAYLAPDDFQLGVRGEHKILLRQDPPENNLRPAVSYLFRSVAEKYGKNSLGVLLTGMGKDGAAELKQIADAGGITIAQDKATSIVHGMPGEAIRLGAATHVESIQNISEKLKTLVN